MIEKDEKWFVNAIDVLRDESLSEADAIRAIIELFHLGVLVPQSDLAEWLATKEKVERVEYLRGRLEDRGGERLNAGMVAELLEQLPIRVRQELIGAVLQAQLPSLEVALQILNLWYRANRGFFGIPFEMAKLAYKLATKNSEPSNTVLCRGVAAETLALAASAEATTVYELSGPGSGESFKRAVFDIAGTDVELRNPHDLEKVGLKESFSVGLVADALGTRAVRSSYSKLDVANQYPNVSPTVSELMTMMKRVSGRIACIVPQSWLHKSFGDDAEFKRSIVSAGYLDAVVQLPERTLIGMSAAPALLIINTTERFDSIQFIDARQKSQYSSKSSHRKLVDIDSIVEVFDTKNESEISKYVTIEEILENDVNLDVTRYLVDSRQESVQKIVESFDRIVHLVEAVEIIRCQAIRTVTSPADVANSMFSEKYTEISPAQVNHLGVIDGGSEMRKVTPLDKDLSRARRQVLKKNDVLFSIKGNIGKCALVPDEFEGFIGNQSFVILRSINSEKMPPLALYRYLMSPLGQALVSRWATSGGVPMIKMQDLKRLPVPLFSADDLKKIEKNQADVQELSAQLADITKRLDQSMHSLWPVD